MVTKLDVLLSLRPESAAVVGAHCGIHPSLLSAYRRQKTPIRIKHAQNLAHYFGVATEDLRGTADREFLEKMSGRVPA